MTEIADRYRRLSQSFADRVAAVPADAWHRSTPCEEWDTLDLVRHVTETPAMFFKLVDREMPPLPSVADDPVAAFDASRQAVQADLDDPVRATTGFEGFFGPSTFEEAIDRFVCFDLVVHGWDLAKATGQDDRIDPADVQPVRDGVAGFGDALRTSGVCGPEVEAPEGADDQTRLLALLGRRR